MKEKFLIAAFFGSLTLLAWILCSLQTTFWYQWFSSVPAPNLWIPVVIYCAMYRTLLAASLLCYILVPVFIPMTSMTESAFIIASLCVVFATQAFKRRIYWQAASYTMLITAIGSITFSIGYWVAEIVSSRSGWINPSPLNWLIVTLLSPIFAPPVIQACRLIERMTRQEQIIEFTAEVS